MKMEEKDVDELLKDVREGMKNRIRKQDELFKEICERLRKSEKENIDNKMWIYELERNNLELRKKVFLYKL